MEVRQRSGLNVKFDWDMNPNMSVIKHFATHPMIEGIRMILNNSTYNNNEI